MVHISYCPGAIASNQHWEANVKNGQYIGMDELLAMQDCKPLRSQDLPSALKVINSLLTERLSNWERLLGMHTDTRFKAFILSGLKEGFRVGLQYKDVQQLKTADYNLPSCMDHPEVVTKKSMHWGGW